MATEDVICLYWPWAEKKAQQHNDNIYSEAMNAQPCLSVMHAKAHSWSYQVHADYVWYIEV